MSRLKLESSFFFSMAAGLIFHLLNVSIKKTQQMTVYKLNRLTALFIIGYIIILIYNYNLMPEYIAIHINFKGEVDNLASKKFIFLDPLLNFIIYYFITYFIKKPEILNYGTKVTPQNKNKLYNQMQLFLTILNFIITFIFTVISISLYVIKNINFVNAIFYILSFIYFLLMFLTIKAKRKQ